MAPIAVYFFFIHATNSLRFTKPTTEKWWPSPKHGKNLTDEDLMVDMNTFVVYNSRKMNEDHPSPSRKRWPRYHLPGQRDLNLKIMDMMLQQMYSTQYRFQALKPILDKYKDNPALRMAFIFSKLKQLTIDIRRIYTLAMRQFDSPMKKHIVWYSYCTRKHIDVLYIVEHVIDLHTASMKQVGSQD